MLEQIIALLLTLTIGGAGLTIAVERLVSVPQSVDAVGPELADEMAALQAAAGLARAAEARAAAGTGDDLVAIQVTTQAVDGLAQAVEALTQAMENAPEEAGDGLQRALEAVTTAPANARPAAPTNGGPPEEVPPSIDAPPVIAPPVDPGPPEVVPPVDTPAGPPSGVPGGRP
jgi:hypothetical protein